MLRATVLMDVTTIREQLVSTNRTSLRKSVQRRALNRFGLRADRKDDRFAHDALGRMIHTVRAAATTRDRRVGTASRQVDGPGPKLQLLFGGVLAKRLGLLEPSPALQYLRFQVSRCLKNARIAALLPRIPQNIDTGTRTADGEKALKRDIDHVVAQDPPSGLDVNDVFVRQEPVRELSRHGPRTVHRGQLAA